MNNLPSTNKPLGSKHEAHLPRRLSPGEPAHPGGAKQSQRSWWLTLILRPVLFLACGAILIVSLGVVQQLGWISAGGGVHQHGAESSGTQMFICPMMCTPPQSEPGRCPVCAMELVPASAGNGMGEGDSQSIRIDTVARRVANIQTVPVQSKPVVRTIRAVGDLRYNESSLRTISAYVDGRLERLYADYTGVEVRRDDRLALVYSPRLYSAQVEYLLAAKRRNDQRSNATQRFGDSDDNFIESTRQRLIELGMTPVQIDELQQRGQADSRLHLYAPMSGTVIEKLAVEGQYVREGDPIYRLADLSTLWLVLRLFPEDAAAVQYGQKVEAEVQSFPGRLFLGRVAFIDPNVDARTRTVGVRVVIPNEEGLLRAGDFGQAEIQVPLTRPGDGPKHVYDPELAHQWISPRHPHVVEDSPGNCRECGVPLVPAATLGFTDVAESDDLLFVIPRSAVLMAGKHSVVYVETEPGRFELRQVVLGPSLGDEIVILEGVEEGELVASRGNFLIDSQMQLAGNPSLIDPTRAMPMPDDEEGDKVQEALAVLSPEEKEAALLQKICPVTKMSLGSMGPPPQVDVEGKLVFICCKGCERRLLDTPDRYLINLLENASEKDDESQR